MENDKNVNIALGNNIENSSEAEIQSKSKEDRINSLLNKFKCMKLNELRKDEISDDKGKSDTNETTNTQSIFSKASKTTLIFRTKGKKLK